MNDSVVQAWEESGAVDPQLASPLYNGRIPAEIRLLILKLALLVDVHVVPDHDWRLKETHEVDFDSDVEDGESDIGDYKSRRGGDFQEVTTVAESTAGLNVEDEVYYSEDDSSVSFSSDDYHGHNDRILNSWDRPDASGPRQSSSPVLRLCRRTYIELTESKTDHSVWPEMRLFCIRGPRMEPMPKTARPRRAHFYTQMLWLSGTLHRYINLNVPGIFDKLRYLRLTFRRGDWWNNEDNASLHVDPFGTGFEGEIGAIRRLIRQQPNTSRGHAFLPSDTDALARDLGDCYERYLLRPWTIGDGSGAPMLFPDQSWALAFAQLPGLEKLTIDFETVPDKQEEMDLIVDWAVRDWIFPMYVPWRHDSRRSRMDERDGGEARERFLSAAGGSVRKTSWRGLPHHYSPQCPDPEHRSTASCGYCQARRRRETKDMGPRLLMWTVDWTPREALDDGTELVFREVVAAPGPYGPVRDAEDDGMWRRWNPREQDRRTRRWGFRPRRTAASPA